MNTHLSTILSLSLAASVFAQAEEKVQKKAPVTTATLWQLQIGGISG